MANHVDGIDMEYTLEAWGDAPPLTGHTLFAEAATEKQRADTLAAELAQVQAELSDIDESLPQGNGFYNTPALRVQMLKDQLALAQSHVDEMRAERDAANMRAEVNRQSLDNALEASRVKHKIIAGLNQKIVSANRRAEQAEMIAIVLARKLRIVKESRARLVWFINKTRRIWFGNAKTYGRDLRKQLDTAEADARALAERVFDTELLSDAEIEIVSRYLPREQMNGAGYKNEETI